MSRKVVLMLCLVVLLMANNAIGQVVGSPASHSFVRPTADELFTRCGRACDPAPSVTRATRGARAMAVETQSVGPPLSMPLAVLRSPGTIVTGTSVPLVIDVVSDFDRPVWIAGRVYTADDMGNLSQIGKAFYASKNLSVTPYGPGYFPALYAGAVIPFGEVPAGNAGDMTVVQVQLYDSQNGGKALGPPLQTVFWSRVRGGTSAAPASEVSKAILANSTITLTGHFPAWQQLVLEVGDPEWDAGFVVATSTDGKTLKFQVPPGHFNNQLYPSFWQAQSNWTIVVTSQDGSSTTFSNILQVVGSANGAIQVQ